MKICIVGDIYRPETIDIYEVGSNAKLINVIGIDIHITRAGTSATLILADLATGDTIRQSAELWPILPLDYPALPIIHAKRASKGC